MQSFNPASLDGLSVIVIILFGILGVWLIIRLAYAFIAIIDDLLPKKKKKMFDFAINPIAIAGAGLLTLLFMGMMFAGPVGASMNAVAIAVPDNITENQSVAVTASGLTVGSSYVIYAGTDHSDYASTKPVVLTASSTVEQRLFNVLTDANGVFTLNLLAFNGTMPNNAETGTATTYVTITANDTIISTNQIIGLALLFMVIFIFVGIAKSFNKKG